MMGSFKIEERENRYYIIPTASYLSTVKEIYTPYDTNFLIYKLFDYEPKEFIHYLCSSFEAKVIVFKSFPYVNFSFSKYSNASDFLKIINERVDTVQEKSFQI